MNVQTTVTRDDETGDIIVGEETIRVEPLELGHAANIALNMKEPDVEAVGSYVIEKADTDKQIRTEWEQQNERAMQLLGIGPESKPDDTDYEDANTSDHPLLLSALTRFQSTAVSEMLPPEKVCTAVSAYDLTEVPEEDRETVELDIEKACKRVEAFYLDYLTERLRTYESDTDLILRDCGLHGAGIRKVYVDPTMVDPVRADYVAIEDLIISYDGKRLTHRFEISTPDLIRLMQAGVYRVVDLGSGESAPTQDVITKERDIIQGLSNHMMSGSGTHTLYETHCMLFLPDDPHPKGLARPYVVTVHETTNQVLAIRRNWIENDSEERPIQAFVCYPYHPGKSSIFTLGLGALLANQTEALRDGQRAGLDAAYLANHPAGFKKSSLSIRDDSTRVIPGEFVDVDSPGAGPISDALMLHPFRGPDPGLMQLMDKMDANGKELGGVATADLSGMMSASVAPGPALAAFDEQTKFQSAVHRRIYRAHRVELSLIHDRMREIKANQPVPFGMNSVLQPTDLIVTKLLPAMDPSQATRSRRLIEKQLTLDIAEKFPEVLDKRAAVIDFLMATGAADIEHLLIPTPEDAKPLDVVSEYKNFLKSMPVVAGPAQNHQAHIEAHTANMMGLQGSNLPVEQVDVIMSAMAAHIADHMALELAVQVSAALGIPMQQLEQGIPPEIEYQIAPMMAQAVQGIEEMRKADNPEDTKVIIERMKAENRIAVEKIKGQFALQREAMQAQQNAEDNETRNQTNREDNATSLLIAGIKGSGSGQRPSTNPNPSPGVNNPNPKPRARTDQ